LSKAEKALQHGCSDPNRLNIPKVSDGEGISLAFGALFVWKICGYIGTLYICLKPGGCIFLFENKNIDINACRHL